VPAPSRNWIEPHPLLLFSLLLLMLFVLHLPLLNLPYFWDEAGYYIPATRDLLLSGSLIPHSTPSNAHPPLVMAYLALWCKVFGYAPPIVRTAMLTIAAFSLFGLYRLAADVSNFEVAVGSTICTALYPVFFSQSSLAQVDLAAAGFTFWGLRSFLRNEPICALWFSLAVLTKETAILAPLALFGWEIIRPWVATYLGLDARKTLRSEWLLVPLLPLCAWYAYHYAKTGFVLGNPEFFRYNVQATIQPLRVFLALLLRLWQLFGYLNLYVLTGLAAIAMTLPPLQDGAVERKAIRRDAQFAFYVVIAAYAIFMAFVGGAVLSRYLLPAVPLVILLFVSTLRRRFRRWRLAVALGVVAFILGLFVNPPYGFSLEDNLAYRDYILLHQHGENFLEARYPMARVLTAWPGSDELTRPYLGYVTRPVQVVRIENFTTEQLMSAADARSEYDLAFVFSTKYQPRKSLLDRWQHWQEWKARFFDYHRDLPPQAAAQMLGGQLVFAETRQGQWVGVIEIQRDYEARSLNATGAADDKNASLSPATLDVQVEVAAHHARRGSSERRIPHRSSLSLKSSHPSGIAR